MVKCSLNMRKTQTNQWSITITHVVRCTISNFFMESMLLCFNDTEISKTKANYLKKTADALK